DAEQEVGPALRVDRRASVRLLGIADTERRTAEPALTITEESGVDIEGMPDLHLLEIVDELEGEGVEGLGRRGMQTDVDRDQITDSPHLLHEDRRVGRSREGVDHQVRLDRLDAIFVRVGTVTRGQEKRQEEKSRSGASRESTAGSRRRESHPAACPGSRHLGMVPSSRRISAGVYRGITAR